MVEPGAPVVNPKTGEVLGRPLRLLALLQVSWVQPRFCQARLLSGKKNLQVGARVRRFEGLTAVFIDGTGKGEGLFLQLRDALDHLRWTDYRRGSASAAPASQLTFFLGAGGLDVRGPDGQLLRQYPTAGQAAPAPPSTGAPAAALPASPPLAVSTTAAAASGYRDLGRLPLRAVVASFIRQDNRLLLAVSGGHGWQVLDASHGFKVVTHSDSSQPGKVLGLHWWQPAARGPLYLALTRQVAANDAASGEGSRRLTSTLYRLDGERPVRVHAALADMVASFDLDGDGRPETLLGQDFDRDILFGSRIRQFHPAGDGVTSSGSDLSLPLGFPVLGGALCSWGKPATLKPAWVRSRALFIARQGKSPYQLGDSMGGSLLGLTYDVNPGAADRLFQTASLEVAPICADLARGKARQLVAVASEGGLLRLSGVEPEIRDSWLVAVSEEDGHFRYRKLGPQLDAAVQGLTWDQGHLLLVTSEREKDAPSRLLQLKVGSASGGQ